MEDNTGSIKKGNYREEMKGNKVIKKSILEIDFSSVPSSIIIVFCNPF